MNYRLQLIRFVSFIYDNYICEDWSVQNKLGKIVCYVPWTIRSFLIWVICPVFITKFMMEERMKIDPAYRKIIEQTKKEFQNFLTKNLI